MVSEVDQDRYFSRGSPSFCLEQRPLFPRLFVQTEENTNSALRGWFVFLHAILRTPTGMPHCVSGGPRSCLMDVSTNLQKFFFCGRSLSTPTPFDDG